MNAKEGFSSRSWTENDSPSSGRGIAIAGLSLLLIVALAVFLRWIWVPPAPQVFAFSVSIDQTSERLLPKPAFTNWSISQDSWAHWRPWLLAVSDGELTSIADQPQRFVENVRTKNELEGLAARLQQRFVEGQGSERDTLFIYLRGLALATSRPLDDGTASRDLFLLAPEFDGSTAAPQGVLLKEFLESIRQIPAANLIIAADFTDLPVVPQLGQADNDVPALLASLMGQLDEKNGQSGSRPLWLICSASSGQPNHVSYLLGKTLLQRSMEYALRSTPRSEQALSLGDFYEAILRYSHHVSQAAQLPLLFRCGSSRAIDSLESPYWTEACAVRVASPAPQSSLPQEDPASQAVKVFFRSPLEFSALYRSSESSPSETADEVSNSEATPPPVETDAWLRFWQLRDQLTRRDAHQGWSPVDFASHRFAEIQWEALRLQRLNSLADADNIPRQNLRLEISKLTEELEFAQQTMGGSATSSSSPGSIGAAWRHLKTQMDQPHRPERVWLSPSLLAPDLLDRWRSDRQLLGSYMDGASEVAAWLELCLAFDLAESGELRPTAYELAENIARMQTVVGRVETVMDQSIDSVTLNRILGLRQQLNNRLAETVNRTAAVLEPTSDRPITWKTERTIQRLLSSPLLDYEQRRRLSVYHSAGRDLAARLVEPGVGNTTVDRNVDWPELLKSRSGNQAAAQEWLSKLQPFLAGTSAQDRWLKGCFQGMWKLPSLDDAPLEPLGMILPVSSDTGIFLAGIQPRQVHRHQLPEPLALTIRHRNGTSVDGKLWLTWDLKTPLQAASTPAVQAASPLGRELSPGIPQPIELDSNDQTRVDWKMPPTFYQTLEGLTVELRIAQEESADATGLQQSVILVPPNPDRIDLFVRSWDAVRSRLSSPAQVAKREQENAILRNTIRVPAIGHKAVGQYQFYLCNRSSKNKTVKARLYPVQSAASLGGGNITLEAIGRTLRVPWSSLEPMAESEPVELPGAAVESLANEPGAMPDNARAIVLQPLGESPHSSKSFGSVLVIEEVQQEELPTTRSEKPIEVFWLDCLCSNPQPLDQADLRLITVRPVIQDQDVQLQLEVNQSTWQRWQLEALRVEVHLTDDDGNPIPNREVSATELSFQRPSATLALRPDFSEYDILPSRIVMHLDIGDYPRAVAYRYRPGGGSAELATQAFMWLDTNGIELFSAQAESLSAELNDAGRIVLPSRLEVSQDSTGKPIEVDQLSIPVRMDFPRILQSYQATLELDSLTPVTLSADREFESRFNFVEGRLAFSCTARDHRFVLDRISRQASLRGVRAFSATIDGTGIGVDAEIAFDREPPKPAEVRVAPSASLYAGESLTVELNPSDEHSGIAAVFFALNRPRGNEREVAYDDGDIQPIKAVPRDGIWQAEFNADDYLEFLGPVGQSHQIVARSVDLAGNIQDRNRSARIYWSGSRASVPQPAEPAEPTPKTDAPKEYTVTLNLVADGKPALYPERIQVSGLEYAQMSTDGKGRFTFSKVPQGTYEVKATYSLPSGTTFEAVQPLQVSSPKNLNLNMRRAR